MCRRSSNLAISLADILSDTGSSQNTLVEAIRSNSKLEQTSRKWHELQERIRSSPHRSPQTDPDNTSPRSRRFLTATDTAEIVQAYEACHSTQRIGSRYGMSKARVATILREQDVPLRRQGLTDEQVSEAAKLYDDGRSLARRPLRRLPRHNRQCA